MSYIGKQLHEVPGQTTAVASGTLADGSKIVVNANGTVSAVANTAGAKGSPTVFETGGTTDTTGVFDSNSNKVVIVYRDLGNSGYGTLVVGTVNAGNNTITFGSPAVWLSLAPTQMCGITFDSNSNKVVVIFNHPGLSNKGTAVVGTVSGTSVSFGANGYFTSSSVSGRGITFDSNVNKVIIAFKTNGESPVVGKAVVGTVSGTNISFGSLSGSFTGSGTPSSPQSQHITFDTNANRAVIAFIVGNNAQVMVATINGSGTVDFGTPVVFDTANGGNFALGFDSNSNKVVIPFGRGAFPNVGSCFVGTVSGTGISLGTRADFDTGNVQYLSTAFNTSTNKMTIAYGGYDGTNSFGSVIEGTVSGTSISFSNIDRFEPGSPGAGVNSMFDSNVNRAVIVYQDDDDGDKGKAVVFQNASSTNLSAEKYIGISNAIYASGDTATIQLAGTVDDAQSSLTPGQTYFVQPDGTLGTSAGTPSVVAGTAVSSTELVVKG